MLKNTKKVLVLALAFTLLIFNKTVKAEKFQRKNSFVNAKGAERVAEIKRFQALNNIIVTGKLDKLTEDMLNDPDYQRYDLVKNPPSKDRWIVVNKTKRILTVYHGDVVEFKYPVALGTSKTPTPSAKATITNMAKNPAWGGMNGKYQPRKANDPLNPLGERWMGLKIPGKSGYGIHGTIKPWQIGGYVSNGCIRMFNYDIENYVFPRLKSGAPVWIGTDQELKEWGVLQYVDRISNNQSQEKPEAVTEETSEEAKAQGQVQVEIVAEESKSQTEAEAKEIIENFVANPDSIIIPGKDM
ncbi:MAG: L,D-transpeptidase [Bacillota bacterium]|nr:L,D-transpeptidase [Bacillota bacterium]